MHNLSLFFIIASLLTIDIDHRAHSYLLFKYASYPLSYCSRTLARKGKVFLASLLDPPAEPVVDFPSDLEQMKVVELKQLLKQMGGKPGTLKKAEIIQQCRRLIVSSSKDGTGFLQVDAVRADATPGATLVKFIPRSDRQVNDKTAQQLSKSPPSSLTRPAKDSKLTVGAKFVPQRSFVSNASKSSTKFRDMPALAGGRSSALGLECDSKLFGVKTRGISGEVGDVPLNQRSWKSNRAARNGAYKEDKYNRTGGSLRGLHPTGIKRDERMRVFNNSGGGDLELTFLGTASCTPTVTRGVSCLAMRHQSDVWLFDCGESSQVQVQSSRVKPSKIRKIFITHAHGDHSFGLPGVLCLMGQSQSKLREAMLGLSTDPIDPDDANESSSSSSSCGKAAECVEIFGPEGTRDFVRATLQLTYSKVAVPYRVHELKDVPFLHRQQVHTPPKRPLVRTRPDTSYGELPDGSRDIYPNENGHYDLIDDDTFVVQAAPLQHTVPCVGYVVVEKDRPGSVRVEHLHSIVEANKESLPKEHEVLQRKGYRAVYRILKSLQPEEEFRFPDGQVVRGADVLDPPKKGRKLVVLGDTCDSSRIEPLAKGADVVVHEATNAFIPYMVDTTRYRDYYQLESEAFHHGHSTPQMAGRFAARVGAKQLLLTHFSPRYLGDASDISMRVMWQIEQQARKAAAKHGATEELVKDKHGNGVIAAWDHMSVSVPHPVQALKKTYSLQPDFP